jgi:phosphatidylglycerophosphate synthase
VIALLPFIAGYWPKIICLVIFIAASVTDVIDGRLARRNKQVSDLGAMLDPIADKLLLLATMVPIWWISGSATTSTTSRSGAAFRSGSACS